MKNEFPFGDFDLRTFMGEFRLPAMDSNKLVEAQRRNLEAIQHASDVIMSSEGVSQVASNAFRR